MSPNKRIQRIFFGKRESGGLRKRARQSRLEFRLECFFRVPIRPIPTNDSENEERGLDLPIESSRFFLARRSEEKISRSDFEETVLPWKSTQMDLCSHRKVIC